MIRLTPLELAIMRSLWRRRAARVRDVRSDLLPRRKLAYTTVMTVIDRLFKKSLVRRTRKSRAYVYEPAVSEEEARADAVTDLVDGYFSGSRAGLQSFLGGGPHTNPPDPERAPDAEAAPIDDALL